MPLKQVGQVHLITDHITQISSLPKFAKQAINPIVFDLGEIEACFVRLDIISGRNIIAGKVKKIPIEDKEGKLIAWEPRCLGAQSGNQDKALWFSCFEWLTPRADLKRHILYPQGDISPRA